MKVFLIVCIIQSYTQSAFGQNLDSATTKESPSSYSISNTPTNHFRSGGNTLPQYQSRKQKEIVSKDHIVYFTVSAPLSFLEVEITDLESRESTALAKRDTITLMLMWARDFTLDEPTSGMFTGKNTLPFYASFMRVVEKLSSYENMVFTSGYELFQKIQSGGKLGENMRRNYSHTWTKRNGIWKLTSSTHEPPVPYNSQTIEIR